MTEYPIWLTDRSRHMTGLSHCEMARFIQYYALDGGIVRRGSSIPLSTGTAVHDALARILQGESVDQAVETAKEEYRKVVNESGILDMDEPEELTHTVLEQSWLTEVLVRGWHKTMYPILMDQFEIVCVEQEELLDIELPDVTIRLMSRPDFIARNKQSGALTVHDFKTTASLNESYIEQWRSSVQRMAGVISAEKRLGEPISHFYIHALVKGDRRADYNPESHGWDGPKRQTSPLCYAWYAPPVPPLSEGGWAFKKRYKTESGKYKMLGKEYERFPVWEKLTGKQWIELLEPQDLYEFFAMIGPFERVQWKIDQFLRSLATEEDTWWRKIEGLSRLSTQWSGEVYQSYIDSNFSRSYDCFPWGRRCQFWDICNYRAGVWQDPIGSGFYKQREPHHQEEMDE